MERNLRMIAREIAMATSELDYYFQMGHFRLASDADTIPDNPFTTKRNYKQMRKMQFFDFFVKPIVSPWQEIIDRAVKDKK